MKFSLTSFIGTTWEQRRNFMDETDAQLAQLDEIADHYDERSNKRREHIARLNEEIYRLYDEIARVKTKISRLEAKDDYERHIWRGVLHAHTAINERIIAMYNEEKKAAAVSA